MIENIENIFLNGGWSQIGGEEAEVGERGWRWRERERLKDTYSDTKATSARS